MPRKDYKASLAYGREYRNKLENKVKHNEYCKNYLKNPVNWAKHSYRTINYAAKKKGYAGIAISIDEFIEWYLKQTNKDCRWCGYNENINIDHDHVTGVIRGFLCRDCNLLEGIINKKGGINFINKIIKIY